MASLGHRLARDAATLAAGQILVRLVGLFATLYLTRTLGPTAFGALSLGLAVALVFSACAGLGFDDLVVREVARASPSSAYLLGDAFVLRLLTLPAGALGALGLTLAHPEYGALYPALLAHGFLHSYLLLICSVLRGQRRMGLQSLLLAVQVLLAGGGSILLAHATADAATVALAYPLATVASLGLGQALLRRHGVRPAWRWRPGVWRAQLGAALPFGATVIGFLLYDRLALLCVAAVDGQAATGWFGAAHNLVLVLTNLPAIVMLAAFPGLARAARAEPTAVGPTAIGLARLALIVGLIAAALLYVLAPTIVPLLFGPDYEPSIGVLRTLALGLPAFFLSIVLATVLEAIDRQRVCAAAVGGTLLLAAPGVLAATWLWGYRGGAGAYVAAHLLLAVALAYALGRALAAPEGGRARPALAAAAAE
ncbi:MAG TPA: flippase [Chloroflexota bacterium]|jgi:PST family polysaccharide transporter